MTRIVTCLVALAAFVMAGCGAPSSSPTVALENVPYNLLSPAPTAAAPTVSPTTAVPYIYFVDTDHLVRVPALDVTDFDDLSAVAVVLAQLSAGPSDKARGAGLSTALGPDVVITAIGLSDDGSTAILDIDAGSQEPAAGRLPLAVGQIVLSVTSITGINRVRLTVRGVRIEVPLPGGALVGRDLSSADYASLLVDPGERVATPVPLPPAPATPPPLTPVPTSP